MPQPPLDPFASSSSTTAADTTSSDGINRLDMFHQRKDTMFQQLSDRWHSDGVTQRRTQVKQGLQSLGTKLQQSSQEIGSKLNQKSQDILTDERKQQVKGSLQKVGTKLQQLNLPKLINNMEKDQELADQLGMFNERMKEEAMRRDVRREAEEACLQTMRDHLTEFLEADPMGTYEGWIEALHPENTQDASLLHDMAYTEVDLRFYVEESDHRKLWNSRVTDPHRQVTARSTMWGGPVDDQQPVVDLLGGFSPSPPDSSGNALSSDPFGEDVFAKAPSMNETSTAKDDTPSDKQVQDVDLISF